MRRVEIAKPIERGERTDGRKTARVTCPMGATGMGVSVYMLFKGNFRSNVIFYPFKTAFSILAIKMAQTVRLGEAWRSSANLIPNVACNYKRFILWSWESRKIIYTISLKITSHVCVILFFIVKYYFYYFIIIIFIWFFTIFVVVSIYKYKAS